MYDVFIDVHVNYCLDIFS